MKRLFKIINNKNEINKNKKIPLYRLSCCNDILDWNSDSAENGWGLDC